MHAKQLIDRARGFERAAHAMLAKHETSQSRVVELSETYSRLKGLSVLQDDLFKQSIRCAEQGLYRAAHVMAWAAFIDFLEQKLASDGLKALHGAYSKWKQYKTVEDLRENVTEHALIESARKLSLCTKTQMKALHGLLNKRNECAHPSDHYPGLNETLGYISELLQRIKPIQSKVV